MSAFFHELADAVRARVPRRWATPAGLPTLSPERVFAALCAAAEHPLVDDAGPHVRYRAWVDGVATPIGERLPRPSDGTVRGWLDRVEAAPGELGVIVNDFQAADATNWALARGIVAPLLAALGPRALPVGGTSFDAFVGRYGRTAFGLHKDDQDVLTLVVEGRKRFHVWPFEAFADAPGVTPRHRLGNHRLGESDLAPGAPAPIVLEGGPGDVLFWPAEYWHVAVPVDGEPAVTVGIGLFRPSDPLRFLGDAVRMAEDAGATIVLDPAHVGVSGDVGADLEAVWQGVLATLTRPEVRAQALELLLGWASSYGQAAVPVVDPAPSTGAWRLAPHATLAWYREGDDLVLGVAGTVLRLPWSPALPALFTRILDGRPLSGAEARSYAGEREVDGVRHTMEPEVVEGILGLLAEAGVVEAG